MHHTFTRRRGRGSLGSVSIPPLLFAAHGERARSWADVVRRSHGLPLLAAIDLSAGGIEGLEAALEARPDAAVAVWAKGPLEATRLAERLVEHRAPSLLHPAPARPPLGTGVQITHGWVTLAGISAIERLFASPGLEMVRLRVRGMPEGPALGLGPALYHAATLVHRFGRQVAVDRAVLEDEQHLSLSLNVDGTPWRVEVSVRRGPALELTVRSSAGTYSWSADAVAESLERPGAEPRVVPVVPWPERCLRQLANAVTGADLTDSRAVRGMMDSVELALERRLPPIPFHLDPDRRGPVPAAPPTPGLSGTFRAPPVHELEARSGLRPLGLFGEVPDASPMRPTPPPHTPLVFEALAYRLELRPAIFLTVDPKDEERVRASLPGTIERRERRVEVPPQEGWLETRQAIKVDLFVARDPSTAARLAELQSGDPSDGASSIGALLGYPACCVQAFASQLDRSDDRYNRYAIAARTSFGPGPWPRWLDDTALKLLPHFPCTYRCERSREQADALLAALAIEDPELLRAIDGYLGGPVLYFDHDHQLHFDGAVSEGGIAYRAVSFPWSVSEAFVQLAAAVATGNRIVLGEGGLSVYANDSLLFTLERTDPGLGMIMPFGR